MNVSRIPDFIDRTSNGMLLWFSDMSARDLIFHPEEPPREIFNISDGQRSFDDTECAKLEAILSTMFETFGDDVVEVAYPIFMRKAGALHALDA